MTSELFAHGSSALFSSNRMDWETPQHVFDELDQEFHFTLDAAASDSNHKVARYFTVETNALKQSWGGETVFCNPPYGRQIGDWVAKASAEASKPGTLVVLLVPARTDTRWWHDYVQHRSEIRFLKGRLKFEHNKQPSQSAPFPSAIIILRSGIRKENT